MNAIEIAAVFFGVLYVVLAVKSNSWCWLAGIISSALYIAFDIELKYFQDAILQTYYVVAGFYGWYLWTRTEPEDLVVINSKPIQYFIPFIIGGLILFPIMGYTFAKLGNSFSYIDAFTTVFSFIATWFTAKKIIENWHMWILLNIVFIVQYFIKQAYLTSGLYVLLTIMAVYGYIEWRKQIRIA